MESTEGQQGWRCVNCGVMIKPKGSDEKPRVKWRRKGGQVFGFCLCCNELAHHPGGKART